MVVLVVLLFSVHATAFLVFIMFLYSFGYPVLWEHVVLAKSYVVHYQILDIYVYARGMEPNFQPYNIRHKDLTDPLAIL